MKSHRSQSPPQQPAARSAAGEEDQLSSLGNQALQQILAQHSARELPQREKLGQGTGEDLSDVRAHYGDQESALLLDLLGAEAFTTGREVVLRGSAPDPVSVAHEVVHLTQGSGQWGVGIAASSSAPEQEASTLATALAAGEPVQSEQKASAGVHREASLGSKQLYAHGGYMGLVDRLLEDEHWSTLFRELSPKTYNSLADESVEDQMKSVENDPVMAAFGVHVNGNVPLEWDLWVAEDGSLAGSRIVHGDAGDLGPDNEKKMPGGIASKGFDPYQWLRIFGEAMDRTASGEADRGWSTSSSISMAIEELNRIGGVYLDVKSEYSSGTEVAGFVSSLESLGVPVAGVLVVADEVFGMPGDGDWEEMLSGLDTDVGMLCFHGVEHMEGLMPRLESSGVRRVLINLGSLLNGSDSRGWSIDEDALTRLQLMVNGLGLSLGGYVQESATSPEAHDLLVGMVNDHPDTFALGFAWGGKDGAPSDEVSGSGMGSQSFLDRGARKITEESDSYLLQTSGNLATRYGLGFELLQLGGESSTSLLRKDMSEFASLAADNKIFDKRDSVKEYNLAEPVLRCEAVKMICSFLNIRTVSSDQSAQTFPDVDDSAWYAGWVYAAVNEGLINGYQNGCFGPGDNIKYEHLLLIIGRA